MYESISALSGVRVHQRRVFAFLFVISMFLTIIELSAPFSQFYNTALLPVCIFGGMKPNDTSNPSQNTSDILVYLSNCVAPDEFSSAMSVRLVKPLVMFF